MQIKTQAESKTQKSICNDIISQGWFCSRLRKEVNWCHSCRKMDQSLVLKFFFLSAKELHGTDSSELLGASFSSVPFKCLQFVQIFTFVSFCIVCSWFLATLSLVFQLISLHDVCFNALMFCFKFVFVFSYFLFYFVSLFSVLFYSFTSLAFSHLGLAVLSVSPFCPHHLVYFFPPFVLI